MSLRNVIDRHGISCKVIRQAVGTYTDGRFVPAANQPKVTITAVIQPLSGRELEALPEGQSAEDTRVVFTEYKLVTRTPTSSPDQIEYDGELWRVYQVERWDGLSGSPHYIARIVRQTNGSAPV